MEKTEPTILRQGGQGRRCNQVSPHWALVARGSRPAQLPVRFSTIHSRAQRAQLQQGGSVVAAPVGRGAVDSIPGSIGNGYTKMEYVLAAAHDRSRVPRRQQDVRLSSRVATFVPRSAGLPSRADPTSRTRQEPRATTTTGCATVIPSGIEGSRHDPAGWPLGWGRGPAAAAGQVISAPALRAFAQYDSQGAPNRRCARLTV